MRRLPILVLLALALAAPAQSAAAERTLLPSLLTARLLAEHGAPVKPAIRFRTGFVVEGPSNYKVGVSTFGGAVILEVWRGRKGQRSSTAYLARGVATSERLQATFGKFGKVSMRFRESRNRTWFGKRRNCRGASRFVKRRGVFVGNLRFKGEDGYVSVRVKRAKGAVVTEAAKCRNRRPPITLPDLSFLFFEPDFLPPRLLAPGELAMRAARCLLMPLSFRASYCFSFLMLARLLAISGLRREEVLTRRRATRQGSYAETARCGRPRYRRHSAYQGEVNAAVPIWTDRGLRRVCAAPRRQRVRGARDGSAGCMR